jgi:hypothetical protein
VEKKETSCNLAIVGKEKTAWYNLCAIMIRKILVALPIITLAFLILFISVLRTASLRYEFGGSMSDKKGFLSTLNSQVDYTLPYPGGILPDHPLWPLKVIRDRVWLFITTNTTRKIELQLLFADKRLGSAKILFERNNQDVGVATLEKAERYLIEASDREKVARANGVDTSELLDRLARASLKHYEIMSLMYISASDEARPTIVVFQEIPKKIYEDARNAQLDKGEEPYENPFIWQ